MKTHRFVIDGPRNVLASVLVASFSTAAMAEDLSSIVDVASAAYSARDVLTSSPISGGYTVSDGRVHTWMNDLFSGGYLGYRIGDIATGIYSEGRKPSSINSNGFGDAFGAYDAANGIFYAGTYNHSGSGIYQYIESSGLWSNLGVFDSLYGVDIYQGEVYASGLNAIWDGSAGQGNQIALYDLSGGSRHDVLIQASGNSAHVALDISGNLYYATYGDTSALYRWTANQLESVRADRGHGEAGGGAGDLYLTYADAELLTLLPAGMGGSGIAVDQGGNVFFSVNSDSESLLLLWNAGMGLWSAGDAYHYELIAGLDSHLFNGWFGHLDTEGDFFNGGAVYLGNYGSNGLAEITVTIPEPSGALLLLTGLAGWLGARSRKRRGTLLAIALALCPAMLQAGVYSPGKGGLAEAGFPDAGIPGFIGPAGEGVAATATNGNYVNPIFSGWATGYLYTPSDLVGTYGPNGIGSQFANAGLALGPVTGNSADIVSLGDMSALELAAYFASPATAQGPGTLLLSFDFAITNGPGADFAAFENGFVSGYSTGAGSTAGLMFAELGFLEVSTNGIDFARFPSVYENYLSGPPTGSTAYLTQDVSNIYNLVGKHSNTAAASWGTPFDLDDLLRHPLVMAGLVDLSEIHYVKIVDIPGNGSFTDASGRPIYDAWETWGSGGLDFEALGVIHQVPEPLSPLLLGVGSAVLLFGKRRSRGIVS